MLRIQAPTAHKDVTFNNVKASRSSINDMYAHTITRIEGGVEMEVFETITAQAAQITAQAAQITALLQRLTALEARVNELTVE
jgi:hypothetical protein